MNRPLLATSAAALALIASSCGITNAEAGSGTAQTVTFDLDDFDSVDISGAFTVDVMVTEGPATVTVTVDDNLVDNLDVGVKSGELRIGFAPGARRPDVVPQATVTMPELRELDLSGASSVTTNSFSAINFSLAASGASKADIEVDTSELTVDASGASRVTISGSAETLELDGSGASVLDLDGYNASQANVDLSGASRLTVGALDTLDGNLSGASRVTVPRSTIVGVDTSGASTVERTR